MQAQPCSAGDSSGYERRASAADDVVVVSALRTAVTKVTTQATSQLSPATTRLLSSPCAQHRPGEAA